MLTLEPSIAQQNAAFDAMTPAEKRVQIAKDVILQLDITQKGKAKLVVTPGEYCNVYLPTAIPETDSRGMLDMQGVITESTSCHVCAKGALFAVKAMNYDRANLAVDDKVSIYHYSRQVAVSNDGIMANLDGIFTKVQLNLIENAFEMSVLNCTAAEFENGDYKKSEIPRYLRAAAMFKGMGMTASTRLRKIMERIIENGGDFRAPTKQELTQEGRDFFKEEMKDYEGY